MCGGGQARARDVRAARSAGAARARGDAAGRTQPARPHQVRVARGRVAVKPVELRDMNETDLREHLKTARRELFGLRFQHATGELDNTAGLKRAKREVARALTVARQRETVSQTAPQEN